MCGKIFIISRPISSRPFLIDLIVNWLKNQTLAQIGCFKMTKNLFYGLKCGVLGELCYPGRQKPYLHASIGHFSQHDELISCYLMFCKKKDSIFVFFEILVPNSFENISKSVSFSRQAMNTCFVAKLGFLENFKLLKSVAHCYRALLKKASLIFFRSVFMSTYTTYILL